MPKLSRFNVSCGTSGGFGGLALLLKNGWKALGLEAPSPTFFLRSTTSFDSFLTYLTTVFRSLGSFSRGFVNNKGFFPVDLISSDEG
jgi:hypothetical protein